jgi:hypothetical protein
VPRGQRDGSLRPYSQFSRPEPLLFLSRCAHEVEWTPFQTHYFSVNLVVQPGILTTRPQRPPPSKFGAPKRSWAMRVIRW